MDTADPIGTPHSFGAFLVCALRTGRRFKSYYMNLFLNYTVLRDPHRRGGGLRGPRFPPSRGLAAWQALLRGTLHCGPEDRGHFSEHGGYHRDPRQRAPAALRSFLGPCTPVNDFFLLQEVQSVTLEG